MWGGVLRILSDTDFFSFFPTYSVEVSLKTDTITQLSLFYSSFRQELPLKMHCDVINFLDVNCAESNKHFFFSFKNKNNSHTLTQFLPPSLARSLAWVYRTKNNVVMCTWQFLFINSLFLFLIVWVYFFILEVSHVLYILLTAHCHVVICNLYENIFIKSCIFLDAFFKNSWHNLPVDF